MTSVTIERADNGYIVRRAGEDCEGRPVESVEVCEQPGAGCQCIALSDALCIAVDALGASGSKHDGCRIRVMCKCGEDG